MYSAKLEVENLQINLQEMRGQVGDADLIYLTDNIFQRVHIRQIQLQIETI